MPTIFRSGATLPVAVGGYTVMLPELLATYRLPLRSAAICSGEARPVSDPVILRTGVAAPPRVKVEMAPLPALFSATTTDV